MNIISTINKDPAVVSTTYWDTEPAQQGGMYLSWNAGAARLLVPDAMKVCIKEMLSAKCVIISRNPWHAKGGQDSLELLFEDHSSYPFCIHVTSEQSSLLFDRDISSLDFRVYTQAGKQPRVPGKCRTVARIPRLEPWNPRNCVERQRGAA